MAKNLLAIKVKAETGDLKANQYLLEKKWAEEVFRRPPLEGGD